MKATTIEKAPKISVIVAITKDNNAIGKSTGELLFRPVEQEIIKHSIYVPDSKTVVIRKGVDEY